MLKAIARFIIRKELECAEKTIENLLEAEEQYHVLSDIYRNSYARDQAKIEELEREVRKQSVMIETYESNTSQCYDRIEKLEQEQKEFEQLERELKERIAELLLKDKEMRDKVDELEQELYISERALDITDHQ